MPLEHDPDGTDPFLPVEAGTSCTSTRREYALQGTHVHGLSGTASHPPYDVVASFPIFATLAEAERVAEFHDRQHPDAEPTHILSRVLGPWEQVQR